jgi:hypothetical protein
MMDPVVIIREQDDVLADVRVSLGYKEGAGVYLVFRGNPAVAAELLAAAHEHAPDLLAGRYEDRTVL